MNAKGFLFSFVSTLAPAVLSVLLMPVYLSVLGKEGLGLMATLTLTLMIFGIFSTGAARLLQREIVAAAGRHAIELHRVVWRGWRVYGGLAVGGMLFLGPVAILAGNAVQDSAVTLPADQIRHCYIMMLIMAGITFLYGYSGVILVALGQLVQASLVNISISISTAALSLLLLRWWPRVDILYGCQLGVLAAGSAAAWLLACRAVRQASHALNGSGASGPPLPIMPLRQFLRESSSLVATEGMNVLISQMDRFLVSLLLPLSSMGSYALGATMGRVVSMASGPLNLSVTPSIFRLESGKYPPHERGEYLWRLSFVTFVILCAVCLPLWSASAAILHLWVRSPEMDLSDSVWVLRWLVLGNALLALGAVFYNYMVACSHLRPGLVLNLMALVMLPLPGVWAVRQWGPSGASLCWSAYAFAYLMVCLAGARRCGLPLSGSGPWLRRIFLVMAVAGLAGIAVQFMHGSDAVKVAASMLASLAVIAVALSCSFGFRPQAWKTALEIRTA